MQQVLSDSHVSHRTAVTAEEETLALNFHLEREREKVEGNEWKGQSKMEGGREGCEEMEGGREGCEEMG